MTTLWCLKIEEAFLHNFLRFQKPCKSRALWSDFQRVWRKGEVGREEIRRAFVRGGVRNDTPPVNVGIF